MDLFLAVVPRHARVADTGGGHWEKHRSPVVVGGLVLVVSHVERYVKSVFVVHVGGTRCVTSSTDHYMNIHARITLSVEFIRTCIFLFLFYV